MKISDRMQKKWGILLTNASVNTCTLQDGAHSLGARARPLTHWQTTPSSAQGKHNVRQSPGQCDNRSWSSNVSHWQITPHSAQGKHNVRQSPDQCDNRLWSSNVLHTDKSHPTRHRANTMPIGHLVSVTIGHDLIMSYTLRDSLIMNTHTEKNHTQLCTGQTQVNYLVKVWPQVMVK